MIQSLDIQPDPTLGDDTYIASNSTGSNYGTITSVYTGYSGGIRRTLIRFNISSIPAGSVITLATASLYCSNGNASVSNMLYRCTKAWTESGATWNKYDGTNAWASAGGDWDASLYSNALVPVTSQWSDFNAKDLVTDALANRSGILSLIMKDSNEVASNYSSYKSSDNTSDTPHRPKIHVEWRTAATMMAFYRTLRT